MKHLLITTLTCLALFSASISLIAQHTNKPLSTDSLLNIGNDYLYTNYDSATYYANLVFKVAAQDSLMRTKALLLMSNARLIGQQNMFEIDSLSKLGLRHARALQDSLLIVKILNVRAGYLLGSGQVEASFKLKEEQLEISRTIDDKEQTQLALAGIASHFYQLKDFETALEYHLSGIEILESEEELKWRLPTAYNNLSINYVYLGDYESALASLDKSIALCKELDNQKSLAAAYEYKAECLTKMNRKDEAIEYFLSSMELSKEQSRMMRYSSSAHSLAIIYAEKGDYDKSRAIAEKALEGARKAQSVYMISNLNLLLSKITREQGKARDVYNFYKAYTDMQDSILDVRKQDEILTLEEKFKSREKDRDIQILQQEASISKLQRTILVVLVLVLVAFAVFAALYIKSIKRQKETAAQLARTEKQKLASELAFKNRELSTHALQILHKNQLVANLEEQIDQTLKKDSLETNNLISLKHALGEISRVDKDWEKFNKIFKEVHPTFLERLHKQNPNITKSEVKQAALIKMGLSLKESASILNIAPESVKIGRNRLKKKLGLGTSDDLSRFIQGIA